MPPKRSKSARRTTPVSKAAQPRAKASVSRATVSAAFALPETATAVPFAYRFAKADDHGFVSIGPQAKAILGVSSAELTKDTSALRLHPDDAGVFTAQVLGAMAKRHPVDVHVRVSRATADIRWVHICAWLHAKTSKGVEYHGFMLDITARKAIETEVMTTLDRMEQAQDIARLGWYDMNVQERVIDLTSDFADKLGLPFAPGGRVTGADADKYRQTFLNAIHPEDRERYMTIISDPSWRRTEFDYRVLTRSNDVRYMCSRIERTMDKNGNRVRDFAVIFDITERKRLEEDLRSQAATDPLTGVANRRSFESTARREVERARRYAKPFAVLALDIDHFKRVNDTYGHDIGDIVLKSMAEVCLTKLRATDILARLGGEEFAMLLPETDIEAAATLAERMRVAIETSPIATAKGALPITVSLGVAQHAPNEPTIDAAMKRADEALYEAKRTGRNRVVVARLPSLVRSTGT
jgi:diguanylate cyclase (GGDEF)-like protein/PAS domain S-box-containing protein